VQLEDYFDFETQPVERIRIKGTRIDIDYVIELHKNGLIPEQIAVYFATPITREQVYAAITYYLHNLREIEAYLKRREDIGEANYRAWLAQEPSEVVKRLRAIKANRSTPVGSEN
jgi:uncharacterized protein (DUF433 family)